MKILVVRFSSIGDVVLTTPVLRALRQKFGTNADIHYVCKDNFAHILSANPYINTLHKYQTADPKVLIQQLKAQKFDVVLDLQNNWRSWRLSRAIKAKKIYTFSKLNIKKWLLTRFKINLLPDMHVVDRYIAAGAALGLAYDGQGLDYFIPESGKVDINTLMPAQFAEAYPKRVAIAVGAAHGTKQIPVRILGETVRILAQYGVGALLLGGDGDAAKAESIQTSSPPNTVNLCGKLNLHASADVIRQADAVLAPDTGLMHIAAALQRPLVSVWGSTVPAFGMWPLYPDGAAQYHIIERALKCRPCSKLGYPSCPNRHFACMEGLEAMEIAAALLGFLGN